MVVNPVMYSFIAACFGAGIGVFRGLPKFKTGARFALIGFGLALPYFAIQEMMVGLIIRRFGREQYLFSNIAAGGTLVALLSIGAVATGRGSPN